MTTEQNPDRIARALYRAVSLPGAEPPYNNACLKIFYPARYGDTPEERNSGVIPADPSAGACPVVIMLPGINLSPESYNWLAANLALRGVVTVMPSLVAEEMPGYVSLTPGLSIAALTPEQYGDSPSATLLGPILEFLKSLNTQAPLAGSMDLSKIILGGHSAGGTVALLNARSDWAPGLAGAFSYGAHTAAATALGHPEDHYFVIAADVPVLVMGGTRDGCIANSAARYGVEASAEDETHAATDKLVQTFERSLTRNAGDSHLVLINGANHFALAWPEDGGTGRPFIDFDTVGDAAELRRLLADLIGAFCTDLGNDASPQALNATCRDAGQLIADHRCR